MSRKHLRSALVGLAASLVSSGAFAGSNGVDSTLTRLYEQVSYTAPTGQPVFGYKVEVGNNSTNTQNKVSLTITTAVVDADGNPVSGATSKFAFGDGASFATYCKAAKPGSTSITCSFGQLKSGAQIPAFFVYFASPGAGNFVQMTGLARFAEQSDGAGASNSTTPSTFLPATGGDFVTVGTLDTTRKEIRSGLSRVQTNVVMGTSPNAADQTDDLIQTTLTLPNVPLVPASGTETVFFTTLDIKESKYGADPLSQEALNCTNGAGFSPCYQTSVTIPLLLYPVTSYSASAALLRVSLYIEPAAAKFAKESLIKIYDSSYFGGTVALSACTEGAALPCVEYLNQFKNRNEVRNAPAGYTVEVDSVLAIVAKGSNGILSMR